MREAIAFFTENKVQRLGVATFGPLDLRYTPDGVIGSTLKTPKQGWDQVAVRRDLEEALHVPVTIDTDVNAAALAEATIGAAKGASSCVYVTVGTGIGGGVVIDGKPLHGLMHPEIGHMRIPRYRYADGLPDSFQGHVLFTGTAWKGWPREQPFALG